MSGRVLVRVSLKSSPVVGQPIDRVMWQFDVAWRLNADREGALAAMPMSGLWPV